MMILIVDGVVMDIIEMMVDKQADLRLHMEDDKVTKEIAAPLKTFNFVVDKVSAIEL